MWKIVAAVVAAVFAAASAVLAADAQSPRTMKLACAKKGSGELQYVRRAGDCPASRGKLVRFPGDAPVHACQRTAGGALFRVARPAACRPPKHPGTRAVVLPKTTDLKLCAAKSNGAVRVVGAFSRCKSGEPHVVLKALKAPHADDDAASTGEESPKAIAVLANDDGSRPLRLASIDSRGTRGTVARIAGGRVRYSPNGKFNALRPGQTARDVFRYRASDGVHDSNAATVRVTIIGVNDPPRAADDAATTDKDTAAAITVLANDSDPDGEALSVTGLDTTGTKGSVTANGNGTVTYDPNGAFDSLAPGDTAHDTFKYRANDGHVSSGLATVDVTVTGVNHAPTVATSGGSTSYLEGDPATVVDGGVTVTDDDDASLQSATVAIATGFEAGDQLEFSNQNGISGAYDSSTGVLTLSGSASKTDYQTALRSVRFRSTSDDPATSKTVSFRASDGDLDSAPDTKTLAITRVNDAPSVGTTGSSLAYPENSGAVAVDPGVTVSDPDSATLSSATVRISSSFQSAEDELGFSNQNGITGSYDDSTGTLTLTGDASKADYQAALRTVTYTNSGDNPGSSRTVEFRVKDSAASQSATATRTIALSGSNDAPVVTTSTGSTPYSEGAPATAVDAALTVADPDNANLQGATVAITAPQAGDELQFSSQNGIAGTYDSGTGVLTLSGTAPKADYQTALRSVAFRTTNDNPSPTRSIQFRASDGALQGAAASKTVAVSGVNDAPSLTTTSGSLAYTEGAGPQAIDAGVVVADPDSPNMSGAKVSITGGFASADDELSFPGQDGIAGSYNDSTGVLTLSGTATRAQYETALRSVKYENVSQDPSGTRTVTFQATDDGALPSNDATRQIALGGVNDAPVVTTSSGATAYTEGDAATTVDSGVTVSDPDDANLENATVRISAGLRTGDVLAVATPNGLTVSYDAPTGTLTLSGTASKANYQTALASVTYRSTSDDPGTARTVELSAGDGSASSTAATRSIAIAPLNDAPTLTTSSGALSYREADGAVAVDPGMVLADPDSASMSGATVTISSGFVAAEDELSFAPQNGISGNYSDTTGTMTLSGTATRAEYESALRAVKYENVSDDPTDSRTVSFQVTDSSSAASNTATRDIDVNGVSDPPVVTTSGGSTAYTEGAPATEVDTALTVSDSDDASLDSAKVRISNGLQTGDELSLAPQGAISGTYDSGTGVLTVSGVASKADYQTALRSVKFRTTNDAPTTSRTVEFTVNDGDADSAPAGKGVTITPTNDAPTVTTTTGSLGYTEGAGQAAIDPTLVLTDPDSGSMSGAEVKISANFSAAQDELSFDGQGGPISGSYDDGTGTLTLSGTATRAQYETALRSVTYENVSEDPSPASRTIAFKATDVEGATGTAATRGISITAVNDAPVVTTSGGTTAVTEGAAGVAVDNALTVSDVDDTTLDGATVRVSAGLQTGDVLAVADQNGITGSYDSGVLTLSGSASVANYQIALRSVTFRTTNDNPGATRTIEFTANDGTASSNPATKGLTVAGTNDAPSIATTDTALAYAEDAGPVAVDGGLTVTDPDSANMVGATVKITGNFIQAEDELGFSPQGAISGTYDDPSGTLTLTGTATRAQYETALRSVTYENSSGDPSEATRTITFRVDDSSLATSDPADRDVTVSKANDAPVITPTNGSTLYTEGDAATTVDPGVTVTDADDTTIEGGVVSITSGFQQGDDVLALPPQGNGISGAYHGDTGQLVLTGASSVANYQTALQSITYRHTGDNPVASKTIQFQVSDHVAASNTPTKEIAITAVNDAPAVTMTGADLSYAENEGPKAIDTGLGVSDPDSAQLSGATVSISANFSSAQDELGYSTQNGISGTYDDSNGTLTLSGTATVDNYRTALRSVTYQNVSNAPSPLTRTISVTAKDSANATSPAATRGIAISASNDAPTAVNDSNSTNEDTALNEPAPGVLGNDTDPDGVPPDTRTVTKLNGSATLTGTSAKGAAVTIAADGSYTYDPSGSATLQALSTGDTDSDSFTYTMSDAAGAESSATVNLTITGVSDSPTAVDDTFNTNGNTVLFAGTTRPADQAGRQISASVLTNDTDPDSTGLTATPGTDVPTTLGGKVTIESDGNFTYTPPTGFEGVSDSFTYTVTDGAASDTGVVTIPLGESIWYVSNSAPVNGLGRSSDPFDTLAEAESASNSNDTTYVFDGDDTTTGYDTGYALTQGERLIGEAADLTADPDGGGPLGTETYFTGSQSKRPTLTASGEDVVVLASGATVRGVQLDPSGAGGGIFGNSATNSGTVDDVRVIDAGTPGDFGGLELVGTSGTFDVSNLTVSMQTGPGVRLIGAGTVNFAPAGTVEVSSATGPALNALSTNLGTGSQFDSLTTTASTSGGVSLINTTGTTALGDGSGGDLALTTTTSSDPALFLANAGTVSVPAAGNSTISAGGGPAVDANGTLADLALDSASSTNSATFGINLSGLGTGTFSAPAGSVTGASSTAFRVSAGSGDVSYAGTLGDGPGATAAVSNRTGGTVTLSGPLADGADAGGGITISGNTGGATVFSNASKVLKTGTGDGVAMTSNADHTVTFSGGGLDIGTTSGKGFEAIAGAPEFTGGTIAVTGSGNTIGTTTGRALNVDDTDIGAAGLNFQSITAGTLASGPVNGIRLNATGTAGGLAVSGATTPGSGGTIQRTTGDGVLLKDTVGPTIDHMVIDDSGDNGIWVDGVSGLGVFNSQLNRNGAQAEAPAVDGDPPTPAVHDAGIHVEDLVGTGNSITDTDVLDSHNSNLDWDPVASDAQSTLTVSGSKFNSAGENVGEGGAGIAVNATGNANVKLSISGGELNDNPAGGLVVDGASGTQTRVAADGTRATDTVAPKDVATGATFRAAGTAQGVYQVKDSTFDGVNGSSIFLRGTNTAQIDASFTGNTIGTADTVRSGSETGFGIEAVVGDSATGKLDISDNTVRRTAKAGIHVNPRDVTDFNNGAATVDLTLRDNIVGAPDDLATGGPGSVHGIELAASNDNELCLDIAGNDADGFGTEVNFSEDIFLVNTSVFRLERFTGDGNSDTEVRDFVLAQNPATGSAGATHLVPFEGADDGACAAPALP